MIAYLFEHIRIISYIIVIVSDLFAIRDKKFSLNLLAGDLIFSGISIFSFVHVMYLGTGRDSAALYLLTPALFIWALSRVRNISR